MRLFLALSIWWWSWELGLAQTWGYSPFAPRRTVMLRSGDQVLVRPIRPGDKEGLLDGFRRLTPESRYRRFFSPVPELSVRQLGYLTEVDHRTHEALAVAT